MKSKKTGALLVILIASLFLLRLESCDNIAGGGGASGNGGGAINYKQIKDSSVGDVLLADETAVSLADFPAAKAAGKNAVAVVYKVEPNYNSTTKTRVWGIGLEHDQLKAWCSDNTQAGVKITDLVTTYALKPDGTINTTGGYSDGKLGYGKLSVLSGFQISDYPAWEYACKYGTNNGLSGIFGDANWFLPSLVDLNDLFLEEQKIENSLTTIGAKNLHIYTGSNTNTWYWSSSQHNSANGEALYWRTDGTLSSSGKTFGTGIYVLAVWSAEL